MLCRQEVENGEWDVDGQRDLNTYSTEALTANQNSKFKEC